MNLSCLRTEYRRGKVHRSDLTTDPIEQFSVWMREACESGTAEPTAMSLATVAADGRPLLRTVLLKHLDARGFAFFTNLESRKARYIAGNPQVSLHFPCWPLNARWSSPDVRTNFSPQSHCAIS
ncbi:MAG: pyridoxamine 5'-phosphate oxidase family protein [Chthoniobacter sp.]|nr:pyridoxamine 5'-phosphate oxidase family protein [Chthoniobacter sp.]